MLRRAALAVLPLMAAAALTGCDRSGQTEDNAVAAAARAADAAKAQADAEADAALLNTIEGLAPGQRDGLLFRAIRDAGRDCQDITASARIDDIGGRPSWSARCGNGANFVLSLQSGGTFVVAGAQQK